MAKKSILGIDIGHDRLKLALVDEGQVMETVSAPMPENLLKEGRITSVETMGELLAQVIKENGIKAGNAAVVLPSESVYIKNVSMPMMTAEQLKYNLPFEFSDYITGEVNDYVFDYAVLPQDEKDEEQEDPLAAAEAEALGETKEQTLELMAVGAPRAVIEETADIMRKAGMRLKKAAPSICTYISLIRKQREVLKEIGEEYCILDMGYESIRMYMYKGDVHVATRALEIGLSSLDSILSDLYSVDVHLAHTYLMNNFENCLERDELVEAYENIAVELMRAMNFYRFSNPDSSLSDMWVCGGGAAITPLINAIGGALDMTLHDATDLVPGGGEIPEVNTYVQAIGITFE